MDGNNLLKSNVRQLNRKQKDKTQMNNDQMDTYQTNDRIKKKPYKVIAILCFLLIWEGTFRLGIYHEAIFPSLGAILAALFQSLVHGGLFMQIIYSFYVILKGLGIALILAAAMIGLGRASRVADEVVDLLITIAHPLPGIAIMPLVILWFGIGEKAVLFVVVHAMLWPLLINLKSGVGLLRSSYLKVSKAFNFSTVSELYHIYFMGAVPSIISGCKIAWSRGWRALISAEMIFGVVGNNSGVGWYLFEQRVYMNTAGLYAGLIVIMFCGLFVEGFVFKKIEKHTTERWGV